MPQFTIYNGSTSFFLFARAKQFSLTRRSSSATLNVSDKEALKGVQCSQTQTGLSLKKNYVTIKIKQQFKMKRKNI